MKNLGQDSLFEESEFARQSDESVRELWSLVFLDEVSPADSIVRLTSSAWNVVDQQTIHLSEHWVVETERAQERLIEAS